MVTPPQRGSDIDVVLGRVTSTLHIVNAQYPANDGVYTCIGSNNFNSTNASVTVQVQGIELVCSLYRVAQQIPSIKSSNILKRKRKG